MKRYLALLLALVMLLSLAACTKAPAQTADEQTPETTGTTETATEQTSEQPAAESGTLKLVWHAATGIDTLFENPWRDVQCLYPYMVFDRLVSVNGSGEYVMGLATDYTVSDDGLTYTFTIRDGVTWQDGTPFTADDVVFSLWGNIANPNTAVGKSEISCIEGADAVMNEGAQMLSGVSVDGNTVTVKLTAPSRGFMVGVAQVAILPKHAFEGVAPADFNTCSFWEKPFGTGAYKIDQVSFPDYFTCVRNENYWGEPAGIENVLFTSYATGGNDAIVASMIAGDLDFAYGNAMNDIAVADNIKAQNADVESYLLTSNYMRFFIFNQVGASDGQENPGIKDNRVRQAINLLIDKEAFASLYAGQAEVKTTYLANSHPYYNTDIAPFERDVEKAKELLEEAGFDYSVSAITMTIRRPLTRWIWSARTLRMQALRLRLSLQPVISDPFSMTYTTTILCTLAGISSILLSSIPTSPLAAARTRSWATKNIAERFLIPCSTNITPPQTTLPRRKLPMRSRRQQWNTWPLHRFTVSTRSSLPTARM